MSIRTSRRRAQRVPRALPEAHALPPELSEFNISRSDWWIVVTSHMNVLVEGSDTGTDAVMAALQPHLRTPVRRWTGRPPDSRGGGTLIVRAVDRLDGDAQRTLLEYLAAARGQHPVQVVSTSSQLLFPMIERGLFREELYYRLNTVRVDLNEKA